MAQCASIRAQIGSLQAQLVGLEQAVIMAFAEPVQPAPQMCSHPDVEEVGTFGAPEQRCTVCGQSV